MICHFCLRPHDGPCRPTDWEIRLRQRKDERLGMVLLCLSALVVVAGLLWVIR